MGIRWLALVWLSLLGCSVERPVDCGGSFRIAPGLSPWQEQQVHTGAERLNAWLGRPAIELGPRGQCPVTPQPATPAVLAVNENSAAWYEPDTGVLGIDVDRTEEACGKDATCWQNIAMHELAHSLGLQHLPHGVAGIMADGNLAPDFTDADRAECIKRGVCSR